MTYKQIVDTLNYLLAHGDYQAWYIKRRLHTLVNGPSVAESYITDVLLESTYGTTGTTNDLQ